jgi:hypothetical protein
MDIAAAKPQRQERGSVSRSAVATKNARDVSKAWFQVELLRVTDPRSSEFTQPAKAKHEDNGVFGFRTEDRQDHKELRGLCDLLFEVIGQNQCRCVYYYRCSQMVPAKPQSP